MPTGNGAYVVHKMLEAGISGYGVCPYSPNATLFPPILRLLCRHGKNADLVHTTPDHGALFQHRKIPMVVTFHNYVLDKPMQSYGSFFQQIHWRTDLRWLTKMALKRADCVTAVSDYTASLVRDDLGFHGPIHTITNGVDTNLFFPGQKREGSQVRVLFSGNPSSRKGSQWLGSIIELLDHNIEVLCTGGLRGNDKLPQAERIRYLGHVPFSAMPQLYREVDMILLPTVREGMSLAVLEAMASGLPVVASKCSSIPQQIVDKEGGVLVEVGNVSGFVNGIRYLADDLGLAKRMGEFNRDRAERLFNQKRMVSDYLDLFEAVLDRRSDK